MSTLPRDGFSGRGRGSRRKPLIIGGIALALIVIWSYAVLSYGGGEQAKSTSPQGGGATTEQTTASAVPDEPAYAEGGGTNADSTNGDTNGSTNHSADNSAGDNPERASSGDDSSEGQSSGDAGSGSSEEAQQQPSPPQNQPVGAENEPGGYDPLGRDAQQGDLAPIDEERLRFAAGNYISAAYGYTGNDKDAYNQGVGATVVWPDFFDSKGSSETERYAKQVEESGTTSGAVLTEFETLEITEDRATAHAYFETGSGYTKTGDLSGETQAYRQEMVLARTGATWKVLAVEKIEEEN